MSGSAKAEQRPGGGSWRVEGTVSHTWSPWVALYSTHQPYVCNATFTKESRYFIHNIFYSNFIFFSNEKYTFIFIYLFDISSTWQSLQQVQVYSPRGNRITDLFMSIHVRSSNSQTHSTRCFVFCCHLVVGCLIMLNFKSKRWNHRSDADSPSFNDLILSKLYVTDPQKRLLHR